MTGVLEKIRTAVRGEQIVIRDHTVISKLEWERKKFCLYSVYLEGRTSDKCNQPFSFHYAAGNEINQG